ncbi:MAG: hypothetical protein ACRDIE_13955, partial [Chloroflexota bacterium]
GEPRGHGAHRRFVVRGLFPGSADVLLARASYPPAPTSGCRAGPNEASKGREGSGEIAQPSP